MATVADELSEVQVRVKRIEEPMPEITVTARPIPWYVWMGAGLLAASLLFELARRKK